MKLSCFRITLYTVVNSALEVQKVIKLGHFTDGILSFTWEIPALPFLFPKAVCYIIAGFLTTVLPYVTWQAATNCLLYYTDYSPIFCNKVLNFSWVSPVVTDFAERSFCHLFHSLCLLSTIQPSFLQIHLTCKFATSSLELDGFFLFENTAYKHCLC